MKALQKFTVGLSLALLVIGCARKGEDTEVTQNLEDPPTMPAPVTKPGTGEADPLTEVSNQLPQQMSSCSNYWDSNTLWSQIKASLFNGNFQPYPTTFDPYSYVFPRGLKTKSSRGLGCMNSLMQMGSMLNGYEDNFQPGALQQYLQQMVSWSYRNPSYFGGPNANYLQ